MANYKGLIRRLYTQIEDEDPDMSTEMLFARIVDAAAAQGCDIDESDVAEALAGWKQ